MDEHDDDMPIRLEYFALQSRAGWYVSPKLGDIGTATRTCSSRPSARAAGFMRKPDATTARHAPGEILT